MSIGKKKWVMLSNVLRSIRLMKQSTVKQIENPVSIKAIRLTFKNEIVEEIMKSPKRK